MSHALTSGGSAIMVCTRRWGALAGGTAAVLTAALLLTQTGIGQIVIGPDGRPVNGQPTKNGSSAAGLSSIKIVEKSEFRQVINVARDCVKDKDWPQAVKALQTVLDSKEDHYVQVRDSDATGRQTLRWTSVKFEANNLLAGMPAEGLEVYETSYGAPAKALLDEAKEKGSREKIAEVAQRYMHTRAGIEANELLATLFLARGQNFMAALRFEKLLALPQEHAKISNLTLFKAALAFRRAGDQRNFEQAWKKLETNLAEAGGLKVGDETVAVAKLQEVLNEERRVEEIGLGDWLMVRGNVTNTAQASGSPPLLDQRLWTRPMLNDRYEGAEPDNDNAAKARVDAALKQASDQNLPVIPGFAPIASQGLLVYRSYRGLNAVCLREFKEPGGKLYKAGDIKWRSLELDGSLPIVLEKNNVKDKLAPWLNQYANIPGFADLLYENTTLGTLSSDHTYVYAIDDLAVPPLPNLFQPYMWNSPQNSSAELKALIVRNNLMAISLTSGKLVWDTKEDPLFENSHFLGAPISVGGKLYVLNEKNNGSANPMGDSELRLVCIEPPKTALEKPKVHEPIQLLGMVQQQHRVVQDLSRRVYAAHLAFGEGILVCPTNAGEVFGVDLMTRSLVWSYPYREQAPPPLPFAGQPFPRPFPVPPQPRPNLGTTAIGNWKSAPPAIADGKVVFTAPDAHSVHCINLRDGTFVWKKAQMDGDLYLAGIYQGKVLIVGKNAVRALDLKDGRQLWYLPTGDVPSGYGVASKNVYYVPLKKGEILAVDVEKGVVKAHNRAATGDVTPGSLVLYEGAVISQNALEVAAFPQLIARLDEARKKSQADPENLEKLVAYGELLLKDGQVHPAVEALLKVTAKNPPAALAKKARDRLFEALTDLHMVDFNKASKRFLAEFKALTQVPENNHEQQVRLSKYYRIVGQGREAQGNLVEAFQMYKDFGALPLHRDTGIASLEDPGHKIPVNVWLRGRVSAMMARATPEQREPLERKIAEEWQAVEVKNDPDAIRSFVGMFDVPFRVGRQARVRLAEVLMDRNEKSAYLEAELSLHSVLGEYRQDPATGGRALAALARLEEKKGTADSMRLAAAYYRELARDFGKVKVRGDQTGADLFNELASDKRFLPFLEEGGNPWAATKKIAARDMPAGTIQTNGLPGFVMNPTGDDGPFARGHRLLLDPSNPSNPTVRLVDVTTGKERWASHLGNVPGNQQIFFYLYQQANVNNAYYPNARFRFFHARGHLIVCQVGIMVYGLDGDTGKKLWETTMVEGLQNQQPGRPGLVFQQIMTDPEGNPEFIMWNQLNNQRIRVALGQVGPVEASYVALISQKGLVVQDPLRGTMLWKKMDVSPGSRIFGDDQYLFLIEGSDGSYGAGRVLRANDGETIDAPDFGNVYQHRVRVMGRRILAAVPERGTVTLKLYDVVSGKDIWAKKFVAGTSVCHTEDPDLAAVIEPHGSLTVIDVQSGRALLDGASLVRGRISPDDVKGLKEPLLLADRDRFYLALSKPIDSTKIAGGLLHNNFSNGLRCYPVNGWVLALHRADGQRQVGERTITWKKGDLAWHSYTPIENQMLVLEQFDRLPVLLFSCRYHELIQGGAAGSRWWSSTRSLSKRSGKMVYDPGAKNSNGAPQYFTFLTNTQDGTFSVVGYGGSVQHYIDDGKGTPPMPKTAGPGTTPRPNPMPGARPGLPGVRVPPGIRLPIRPPIRIRGNVIIPPNGQLQLQRIIRQLEVPPAPPAEKK